MRKKLLFAFLPAFVFAAMYSCSVDHLGESDTPLTRASDPVIFEMGNIPDSKGPEMSVEITSNTQWRLLWATDFISGCHPVSGFGDAVINFTVSPLYDADSRLGELIFLFDDRGTERVYYTSFIQEASEYYYFEAIVDYNGTVRDNLDVDITITSNTSWWLRHATDWMYNFQPESGNGDGVVSFSAYTNYDERRSGEIIFEYSDNDIIKYYHIGVSQMPTELVPAYFEIYKRPNGFLWGGGEGVVTIKTNTEWYIYRVEGRLDIISIDPGPENTYDIKIRVWPSSIEDIMGHTITFCWTDYTNDRLELLELEILQQGFL